MSKIMDKKLYWSSIALSFIGLIVSIYMTVYKLTANDAMCLGSGDCGTVNSHPSSSIYGIPVALIGVLGYLAIGGLLFLEQRYKLIRQHGPLAVFGMSITGFVFTVYLIYLEFAVIKAICPFCLISQATMSILFVLSLVRFLRQPLN